MFILKTYYTQTEWSAVAVKELEDHELWGNNYVKVQSKPKSVIKMESTTGHIYIFTVCLAYGQFTFPSYS